jgi:hypothetical protein
MGARAEVDGVVVVAGDEGDVLLVAADREQQGAATEVRHRRAAVPRGRDEIRDAERVVAAGGRAGDGAIGHPLSRRHARSPSCRGITVGAHPPGLSSPGSAQMLLAQSAPASRASPSTSMRTGGEPPRVLRRTERHDRAARHGQPLAYAKPPPSTIVPCTGRGRRPPPRGQSAAVRQRQRVVPRRFDRGRTS